MYSISEVAGKVKLSQKRIREYEKEGFIRPKREPRTNNRIFSDEDIKRILRLKYLIHKKGLTIAGLKQLLAMAPCWKIFECEDPVCAARKSTNGPCWKVMAERPGKINQECRDCAIYLNARTRTVKLFTKEPRK